MTALQISIHDHVSPALGRLIAGLAPANLHPAIGPAVQRLFQDHFLALPKNKNNFPTTQFWPRAASHTTWQSAAAGVTIRVDQEGVLYQWLGGEIESSQTCLTIPATAAAYGHSAREFNLTFAIVTDDSGFLRPALVARNTVPSLVAHSARPKPSHPVKKSKLLGRGVSQLARPPKATGGPNEPIVFYWLVRQVEKGPNSKVIPTNDEIIKTIAHIVEIKVDAVRHPEPGKH
jgi:hypothetical protein